MKYSTFEETLIAALASFAYGASMGIILRAIGVIVTVIKTLVMLPYYSFSYDHSYPRRRCADIPLDSYKHSHGSTHMGEFVFVLIYGVGLILLQYALCDGAFRAYTLVLSVVGATLSYKTVGSALGALVLGVYSCIYGFSLKLFLIFLVPLKLVYRKVSYALAPHFARLCKLCRDRRTMRLYSRKEKEIGKITFG